MYLSRLVLNPGDRSVRRDLADCQHLHRTILSAFPQAPDGASAREHFRVLYRPETGNRVGPLVLVQSAAMPDWHVLPVGYLAADAACKSIAGVYEGLHEGMILRFRLRANPTKRVAHESALDGTVWDGKRVELVPEHDQIGWLERKSASSGFTIRSVRTAPDVPNVRAVSPSKQRGQHANGRLTFGAVVFDGTLSVADAAAFRYTLDHGIGPAKAYGFGLLSIGPV